MVFKHFRTRCILKILLLSGTILLFLYLFSLKSFYAATFLAGILIVMQVISLIRFVEGTNRDLARFLLAIQYEDFSQTFTSAGLGSSFSELKNAFADVLKEIRQARAEKEEHFRYLQTVVQHIGVGVIVYRPSGEVHLINSAALRLLKKPNDGKTHNIKNIKALQGVSQELMQRLEQIRSGEKALVKLENTDHPIQLAVFATEFRLRGQRYKLVSLQNIHSELEEKEMEAWQNLIRVLTHEIMNSITPISSLALTASDLLHHFSKEEKDLARDERLQDIHGALQTIRKRSQGLYHFVEAYRKLTHIPKPEFQRIAIQELFAQIEQLIRTQIADKNIELSVSIQPEGLMVMADQELLEQVLLNLLKNAIQAIEGNSKGQVELTGKLNDRGIPIIQVKDNGAGIPEAIRSKIFIPFFTTKEGGTGIGLSLSRQIMRLHQGTLSFQSMPGQGTVFTLTFPRIAAI